MENKSEKRITFSMAAGRDTDQANAMYSSLQQDKDPHHYQQLTRGKLSEKQFCKPASEAGYMDTRYMDTGVTGVHYGAADPYYVTPVQSKYMDGHSYASSSPYEQPRQKGEYYNSIALLNPQKTENYSDATTLNYSSSPCIQNNGYTTDSSQYAETQMGKGQKIGQAGYSNVYSKGQHFSGARFTKSPGVDQIDLVDIDTKLHDQNDIYEEIPVDTDRPLSRSSMNSTSSSHPILPDQTRKKVGTQRCTKRGIIIINVIISVLIVIGVLVAIGVSLSQRGKIFAIFIQFKMHYF